MKRFLPLLFALVLLPCMIFAQAQKSGENVFLQKIGLNDGQITQVLDIQKTMRQTARADFTHLRLANAQIAEDLLPANPDMKAIDALIDRKAQLRSDVEKSFVAARAQIKQIMGDEAFAQYARYVRMHFRRAFDQWRGRGPMGGQGMGEMMRGPQAPQPMAQPGADDGE